MYQLQVPFGAVKLGAGLESPKHGAHFMGLEHYSDIELLSVPPFHRPGVAVWFPLWEVVYLPLKFMSDMSYLLPSSLETRRIFCHTHDVT